MNNIGIIDIIILQDIISYWYLSVFTKQNRDNSIFHLG